MTSSIDHVSPLEPKRFMMRPLWAFAFVVTLFFAVMLSASRADAAIAIDNTSHGASPNQNQQTLTWSHAVNATNAILIVGVSTSQGSAPSSVTYRGVALTQIITITDSDGNNAATLFYWPASNGTLPVGTANVTVTMPGNNFAIAGGADSFTGVDLTRPLGATVSNQNTNSNPATSNIAVAANEVVVDTLAANGGISLPTPGGSQTQEWSACSGSCDAGQIVTGGSIRSVGASPASPTTISWTLQKAEQWSLVAVALEPTPTANVTATKSGPATANSGAAISYTIALNNSGPAAINGVAVTDAVPAAITGVTTTCAASGSAVCPGIPAGNTINATVATFPVGAITLTVTGTAPGSGTLNNSATVTLPTGTTTPGGASFVTTNTVTTAIGANLTITKIGTTQASPAGLIAYSVIVSESASLLGAGGTQFRDPLSDAIPGRTIYVTGSAACTAVPFGIGCTPAVASGTVTFNLTGGALRAGTTVTAIFSVTVI